MLKGQTRVRARTWVENFGLSKAPVMGGKGNAIQIKA